MDSPRSEVLVLWFHFNCYPQNDSEWEAELEGELNEYEMVGEDGDGVDVEDNPEWENQIEEMLEAETNKKS